MSIGIYKIENLINNKVYIGQSIHIEKRWQEHCQNSSHSLIGKAIQKYGKENFSFQIIEEVKDLEKLNQLEANYIRKYNSLTPNGYNIMLMDNNEHHKFDKYNQKIFFEIIDTIKFSSLSFKEIANLYDLDLSMIYYLNRGDYHNLPEETYPLRSVRDLTKKHYYCIDCGCEITAGANRCSKCDHIKQRKTVRPSREELKKLIRNSNFTQIGKIYGVTDNTVRKWCKAEGLPSKTAEIKQYTNEQWNNI